MTGTVNVPVVNIIMRRDNKVLFVLRQNTKWMNGYYGLPSGHVEAGETFRQAACREAYEEVGIELKPNQLKHLLTFQQNDARGDIRVGIYFEAANWSGEPYNAEPDKHKEIAWLDPDNLPETVIETTRAKFKLIKAGQTYGEFGFTG